MADQAKGKSRQSRGTVRRHRQVVRARQRSNPRVYDRPGKKPEYEPDLLTLRALEDAGDPAYAELPPVDVIDYWYHHVGLNFPTTSVEDSNSATFLPPVPVTNDIGAVVSPMLFI
jgi:hypothetical protein